MLVPAEIAVMLEKKFGKCAKAAAPNKGRTTFSQNAAAHRSSVFTAYEKITRFAKTQ